jgi:fatty acid synthase
MPFDVSASQHIGMEIFLKETSFHGVMLDCLFTAPSEKKKVLRDLIAEGVKSGAVKPLVRNVFAEDEIEQAFRYKEYSHILVQFPIYGRDKENDFSSPKFIHWHFS